MSNSPVCLDALNLNSRPMNLFSVSLHSSHSPEDISQRVFGIVQGPLTFKSSVNSLFTDKQRFMLWVADNAFERTEHNYILFENVGLYQAHVAFLPPFSSRCHSRVTETRKSMEGTKMVYEAKKFHCYSGSMKSILSFKTIFVSLMFYIIRRHALQMPLLVSVFLNIFPYFISTFAHKIHQNSVHNSW